MRCAGLKCSRSTLPTQRTHVPQTLDSRNRVTQRGAREPRLKVSTHLWPCHYRTQVASDLSSARAATWSADPAGTLREAISSPNHQGLNDLLLSVRYGRDPLEGADSNSGIENTGDEVACR